MWSARTRVHTRNFAMPVEDGEWYAYTLLTVRSSSMEGMHTPFMVDANAYEVSDDARLIRLNMLASRWQNIAAVYVPAARHACFTSAL